MHLDQSTRLQFRQHPADCLEGRSEVTTVSARASASFAAGRCQHAAFNLRLSLPSHSFD